MTQIYAARKLLELGPLPMAEFIEITGWTRKQCRLALYELKKRNRVCIKKKNVWAVPGVMESA